MSAIYVSEALGSVLDSGRVRRKTNKTGHLKARAGRVTRGAPEVMVKITGFGKGSQHVKSHIDYISRNGKVELENDRGEVLQGKEAVNALFKDWAQSFSDSPRHKNQRDTVHMVLSMPEGTPDEAVREAARAFARANFGANHEYVFALHTDEPHPHVHLTVKMLGFDGRRLNPRKADLQEWRESFADKMRDQGVDAEATPRSSRGVVRKPEPNVIRHIEQGNEHRPARVSRVRAARTKEAAQDLEAELQGSPLPEKAWQEPIRRRREATRVAWLAAADALDQSQSRIKELSNERPDYNRLDTKRVLAVQRAAALYQSGLESSGRKAPAAAIARMRDVSRLDVVQHRRGAQMLLHPHASDRVGAERDAYLDLRRPRTGHLGVASPGRGSGGDVEGVTGTRMPEDADRSLAERIRAMVAALPAIATATDQLKTRLRTEFSSTSHHEQDRGQDQGQGRRSPESGRGPER